MPEEQNPPNPRLGVKVVLGAAVALIAGTILLGSSTADAISLTLEGPNGVSVDSSQALYASDSNGRAVKVAQVGGPAPGGGKFTEMGVPGMMSDGRVVFGAETVTKGVKGSTDREQWNIFIGNPDAPVEGRVTPLEIKTKQAWCDPGYHGDPYPVADADGQIAFMAALGRDRDGLLFYSHGNLSCLAETGGHTNEGDQIAVLSFGSPQMGDNGEVVFGAFLKSNDSAIGHHAQALLIASRNGIHELAVEGRYGPNHTQYLRPFGLPAAIGSPQGTLAAFTAKTPSGGALFEYDGTGTVRELPTGADTPLGPVSYLSPGRPGLMPDGTLAVLAGCAREPVIFRLQHGGLLDMRIQRGQLTPLGAIIESLGDPVLTANGAMFVGATDSDGHERLYVLDSNDSFFEIGSPEMLYRVAYDASQPHVIFTGTLAVNVHGDYAYLGGK